MKAILITQPGPPDVLQIKEIPGPIPSAHELLVRVHATALNRADLLQRRGKYPAPAGVRGDIPGLEFAGEVEQVGENVADFKSGDRVMGLLPGEGYTEKIVTHERMALPVPDNLSFEQAASVPEVFLTAFDALAQLDVKMGERLLVHAIGSGVGIAALQLAKTAGATVFGTAGSETKLEKAKELGLDVGIHYKTQDFAEVIAAETNGAGVNAILDVVGADYWERNVSSLAPKGRMIIVGLLGGAKTEANLAAILRNRLTIIGTALRPRAIEEKMHVTQTFKEQVLPLFVSGKIMPVIDRVFALADAAEAHAYMEANKNFGKIVLKVDV